MQLTVPSWLGAALPDQLGNLGPNSTRGQLD